MTRISIVPFDKMVKIYTDSHHSNDLEAMKHLETAYEHGMVEVIKELAFTELQKYENTVNNRLLNHDTEKEVDNAFSHAVSLCNSNEQQNSLLDVEEAFNHRSALELEKYFIDGFILGYKFLKKI